MDEAHPGGREWECRTGKFRVDGEDGWWENSSATGRVPGMRLGSRKTVLFHSKLGMYFKCTKSSRMVNTYQCPPT